MKDSIKQCNKAKLIVVCMRKAEILHAKVDKAQFFDWLHNTDIVRKPPFSKRPGTFRFIRLFFCISLELRIELG